MSLEEPFEQTIPKFGKVSLLPGYYFYCGSAHGSGGLISRVTRHLNLNFRQFCPIDYIKYQMRISEVWYQINLENNECSLSHYFSIQENAVIAIEGFGASDCKNKCKAHLWMFPLSENLERLYIGLSKRFNGMLKIYPHAL
jgi:Uri superfamily endonuclease